jgi:nucleotide-binding universal stress UspA family protein
MTDAQTHTILVGLDGTERSRDALALGHVLGEAVGARLLMAYVHPYREVSNLLGHESFVREIVDSIFADSHAILPGATARDMRIVVHRSPAVGLHRLAREENAATVVVGSSQRSRVGRIVPGSTGDRFASAATVPAAIAPQGYAGRQRGMELVGCAFDGRPESRSALRWASWLTRRLDTRLVVFTVRDTVRPGRAIAAGQLRPPDHVLRRQRERDVDEALAGVAGEGAVDVVWLAGDPRLALRQRSWALDLLALGSRPGGPRAKLFGGAWGPLARDANCPLAVVPPDLHSGDGGGDIGRIDAFDAPATRRERATARSA